MRYRSNRPPFFLGGLLLAFLLAACETPVGPGGPGPDFAPEAATSPAQSAESQGTEAPAGAPESLQVADPGQDFRISPKSTAGEATSGEVTGAAPGAEADPERTALLGTPPAGQQIDDDPAQLIGIGPARLDALLGRPDLVRREPPAEIWQYRGAACIFDVFLYVEAGEQRVTYIEARNQTAEKTAPRPCLKGLLRARLSQPYG